MRIVNLRPLPRISTSEYGQISRKPRNAEKKEGLQKNHLMHIGSFLIIECRKLRQLRGNRRGEQVTVGSRRDLLIKRAGLLAHLKAQGLDIK